MRLTEAQLKQIIKQEIINSGLFEEKNQQFNKVGQFDKVETPLITRLGAATREMTDALKSLKDMYKDLGKNDSIKDVEQLINTVFNFTVQHQNNLRSSATYNNLMKTKQAEQAPTAAQSEVAPTATEPVVKQNPTRFTRKVNI